MELLEQYLNAVKIFLPREQKDDIINELSENLRSKMEGTEAELGRPLTEAEQEDLLQQHGNPRLVAERYAPYRRCVAFGRQLIGPEFYPLYIRFLWIIWGCWTVAHASLAIFGLSPGIDSFIGGMIGSFVVLTLIFTLFDLSQHKSQRHWYFPSIHAQLIPRSVSMSGFILFAVFSLWWAALPYFPWLILGTAAGELQLTAAWDSFYWPVLLLLLANASLRIINLVHPPMGWLVWPGRVVINLICLSLLYFFLDSQPYVSVADAMTDQPAMDRLARNFNKIIWWILLCGGFFNWSINSVICGWLSIKAFQNRRQRRHPQTA